MSLSQVTVTLAFVCSFVVNGEYATATDDTFDSLVLKSTNPVTVMFCAEWSDACKINRPDLEEKVTRNPPVTMVYVDIDRYPELAKKYQIRAIPAVHIFNNGVIDDNYWSNV